MFYVTQNFNLFYNRGRLAGVIAGTRRGPHRGHNAISDEIITNDQIGILKTFRVSDEDEGV